MAVGVAVAWAANSISWTQNPQVPSLGTNISVTSGATAITSGTDYTSLWTWSYATNDSFTMPITITNNANAAFTPTITEAGLAAGWTFSTSTLSSIAAKGGTLAVTLTITYGTGTPTAGPISSFTVTVS